jgi:hypothetical protein
MFPKTHRHGGSHKAEIRIFLERETHNVTVVQAIWLILFFFLISVYLSSLFP